MTQARTDVLCAAIARLALAPGEVLVVRPKDGEWSLSTCQRLRDELAARLPVATRDRFIIVNAPIDLDIVAARLNS